jgi:hypothetical protein
MGAGQSSASPLFLHLSCRFHADFCHVSLELGAVAISVEVVQCPARYDDETHDDETNA